MDAFFAIYESPLDSQAVNGGFDSPLPLHVFSKLAEDRFVSARLNAGIALMSRLECLLNKDEIALTASRTGWHSTSNSGSR